MQRVWTNPSGCRTTLRGQDVLHAPQVNKGTAFSKEERQALGLTGLLPPTILTLEQQAQRAYAQYSRQPDDLRKNVYLTALHDRNEVLFYRLLTDHLPEMLPIVYTPTVAQAIAQYSHEYRRPRGLYLSIDHPEQMELGFDNYRAAHDEIDLVVATDGERILGIGDWGVGGIDIAIGKLAVYTAAAGIHPMRVIPVVLDVGTDQASLLEDPLYLGSPHPRVRGERYDAFIDRYVQTVARRFPGAIIHWEDFAIDNARRILMRYRDRFCTFNDDMQGTGAITLAAALSAARLSGVPLREQRVILFGAGTAGIGIAEQLRDAMMGEGLSAAEAQSRFWCLGRKGLLVESLNGVLRDFQRPWARTDAEVRSFAGTGTDDGIRLLEVVRQVHPTMLIGTSTVPRSFTEPVVREMAAHAERPIILPLSNPTELAEAVPADLLAWSDGRALVATGSPFNPVSYAGITYTIAQANNALIFPGLGLGTIVARASRISDGMLAAAARAVAGMIDPTQPGTSILPEVERMRSVSSTVGIAVAEAAVAEGLARARLTDAGQQVRAAMWQPVYCRVDAV
jgi:malate dehydrogenase (oxaloacetate-decarboxylating)